VPGEVIPLRPLTLGELLDAALELLRRNAIGLLPIAVVLALAEQLALLPLRSDAGLRPPAYLATGGGFFGYWLVLAAGMGTEAVAIGLLGGLAGRVAAPALIRGASGPRWLLGRGARLGRLILLVAIVGTVAMLSTAVALLFTGTDSFGDPTTTVFTWLTALLPWLFWYLFSGLAGPALVLERRGPVGALVRSFRLVAGSGWRPGWIRLLGYLAWLAVRIALAVGGLAVLRLFAGLPAAGWPVLVATTVWTLVNGVAYAVLGCLDAVLLVEARMRVEGLDLALGRAARQGVAPERILVG